MLRFFALCFLAVAVLACGTGSDDGNGSSSPFACDPGDARCSGNAIQICNSNERWEDFRVCSSVGQECTTTASRCGGFTGPCCD